MYIYKKGFTLIELLVVISIVGFLTSVVLASLSSARTNTKRASVQRSGIELRNAMALYYSTNGNYGADVNPNGGPCTGGILSNTDISKIIQKINADAPTNANCLIVGQDWVMYVGSPGGSGATAFWCVDGRNTAKFNAGGDTIIVGGVYVHQGYCT